MPPSDQVKQVAVIGGGTIGASWASYFLAQGMRVAISDPNPAAEAYVRRFVANAWPTLQQLGMAPETLSRLLQQLRSKGVVEVYGDRIRLL